ncbi:MAG: hypothetical protein JSV61_01420 [Anaerolineales bacterium]|nr:MAG: hypothetical protein JSV61_01420 [Anaerolineales bacterium]
MILHLLDDSLQVQVFYEEPDCDFEDNVCISLVEDCPEEEKIFIHDETNIFLTVDQAEKLAELLLTAAKNSRFAREEKCQ